QITKYARTPFDKSLAIETFLRNRYTYTLNLTGKPGDDPLAHFLFETRASDAHSWVEVYFPGMDWEVFDPTPASAENDAGFLTRLGQYADWMEITWSEWVIGYDFGHQVALAQNLQRGSHNVSESMRAWYARQQLRGRLW